VVVFGCKKSWPVTVGNFQNSHMTSTMLMHCLFVMHVSSCVLRVLSLFLLSFSDHSLSSSSASHLARYEGITDWNIAEKEGSLSLCLSAVSMVMSEACLDPGSGYFTGSML